ncbi:MAG: M6 family metalloprotease domain-containing protein [Verrucomicrobia bacterium]|nr:M6 family metalloprotease domain-containing protein [Verrucomicrobiota bacterium]
MKHQTESSAPWLGHGRSPEQQFPGSRYARVARPWLLLCALLLTVGAWQAGATAPPQPGELAGFAADGTLAERVAFAKDIGNDKFDPGFLAQARFDMQRLVMEAQGIDPATAGGIAATPPPAWRGMPTTGTPKVLCLLVEFKDYVHNPANTREAIDNALFGAGNPANAPYESVTNYYQRSSYNKLTLQGNTLDWYRTAENRGAILGFAEERQVLIKEVLTHYVMQGHDFSQYDNDGDGYVDLFYVIYAGPNTGWGSFWSAYHATWQDPWLNPCVVSGKRLSKYVFTYQNGNPADPFTPNVIIHETGHALGIPDYYDYDGTVGPDGGVGGLDMMDGGRGDHNCFSKWTLGWLTPTIVGSYGSQTRELRASGTSEDCVMIMPGASPAGQFSEYFMVQNRTKAGNDNASNWPGSGMMIWHLDALAGQNYAYDNSYTPHKLLRLMEADGLEHIENNGGGNADDFYVAGRAFTPTSVPSSFRYNGNTSGVSVTNFTPAQPTMSALFTINQDGTLPPRVVIASPAGGFASPQGTTIAILASADDPTYSMPASVAFYGDGSLISTDTSPPYTASWIGAAVGSHVLTAVATGYTGVTATSAPVAISVTTASPPANDNFASRTTISGNVNTVTGTNVSASAQTSEPNHADRTPQQSVWWTWTPSVTGTATITTAGSNYDTILAAYTGSAIGSLVAKASNDDVGGGDRTSSIIFAVTAGVPIQIAVDGYNGASGTITLNVSVVYIPPANDMFAGASVISNASSPVTVTGTNNGATAQTGEPAHAGSGPDASVWWQWTAPSDGTLQVSTAGSSFDTVLGVYTGAAVNALTLRASNDDTSGTRTSYVSLAVTSGTTYFIAVDGYHGATGEITLQTSFYDINDPPTISMSSPWNGQSIGLNTYLHLSAEAYDPEGHLKEVRFYLNGTPVATIPAHSGGVSYDSYQLMTTPGYYSITATAEDDPGLTSFVTATVLVSAITLPEALNNYTLAWVSGGTQSWSGTAANSHDGASSAGSGTLGNAEQSWFSTTVTGPGIIACWWSVSSEANYDFLTFHVDGVAQAGRISGTVDWTHAAWNIPAGTHTLKWQYVKDLSRAAGSDAGWVDEVVWLTSPVLTGASAVTAPTGVPLTYTLSADMSVAGYSVASGALPDGLTLNPTTGAVTGSPLTAGIFNVTLQGTNAAGSGTKAVTFTIFAALPIPISVETPPLVWTTGGDSMWYGESTSTHDGVDAAQSGDIADSQSVWAQTSVTGPGTLTFWWKVSSEEYFDYLWFFMDGLEQGTAPRISGEVDWWQITVTVPAGNHALRWTYAKDSSVSRGADAAWLDQVVFAPDLPQALDTPPLAWAVSGSADWTGQILTTHDGVDAAQSGLITHSQQTSTEIEVTGAGSLSFWWKVSSELGWDHLLFYLDGVEQARISGEVAWQQRTLAVSAGHHTLRWTYAKDGTVSAGADAGWLDQFLFSPTLPQALDTPALTWTTSGDANWVGQILTTHDGVDAAQSGLITHGQQSTTEVLVSGPGDLSFWWKVSSEANYDYLAFLMDGVEQAGIVGISGEVDWQQQTLAVPAGTHTLSWIYAKDYSQSAGADAAWLDQVVFAPSLSQALDTPTLVWTFPGDTNWAGQILTTRDGVDAAQSGLITHSQQTTTEVSVAGAGALSFWWKVSSEANFDFLRFYLDGVEQAGIVGISGEVDWQQKTLAVPTGTHTLRWTYAKNASNNAGLDAAWLDQVVFAPDLPQALDTPNLVWTTSGHATWAGQMLTTHDGVDAAQSGLITHGQQSTTEILVTGAGTLSFWWKVSSEVSDSLRFFMDGVEQGIAGISGEVDWQQHMLAVPVGPHTLRWTYSKDGMYSGGADAAWLDQVVFAPDLPQALDTPALTWVPSVISDTNWFGQMLTTHDGVDAAQSGVIGPMGQSSTEIVVTGAGALSFWWKVSSEANYDYLGFYLDDVQQAWISGEVDWQQKTLAVPAGVHTLKWTYRKSLLHDVGADAAWLDQVVYTSFNFTAPGTTVGRSLWNRPDAGTPPAVLSTLGTAVPYDMMRFTVSTTGTYTLKSTSTNPAWWDNFLLLYSAVFDPAAPLANVLVGKDDYPGAGVGTAGFSTTLTAGTPYFLVTSGHGNTDTGAYTLNISGVGSVEVTLTVPGTTTGRPTWHRPDQNGTNPPAVLSTVGTAVPFDVVSFTVSASGNYAMKSTGTWDNYLFLHATGFDPANPLTNVVIGNDDFPSVGVAGFNNVTLYAGTTYFLVTSGFQNYHAGTYTLEITGPGRPQADSAQVGSALENWRLTWFGSKANSGNGADSNDYDHDGISNILEFAFGLNPLRDSSGLLPQWQQSETNSSVRVITFTQPDGVSGITYGAEWSTTLLPASWHAMPDTGVAPLHHFSSPTPGPSKRSQKLFLRLTATTP